MDLWLGGSWLVGGRLESDRLVGLEGGWFVDGRLGGGCLSDCKQLVGLISVQCNLCAAAGSRYTLGW